MCRVTDLPSPSWISWIACQGNPVARNVPMAPTANALPQKPTGLLKDRHAAHSTCRKRRYETPGTPLEVAGV